MPWRIGKTPSALCFLALGVLSLPSAALAADATVPPVSPGAAPATSPQPVTFEADVQPLLTRFGCNSGPCHGKSRGQNGFALSLRGFDSAFDYAALVNEGRGRRVAPAAPDASLMLQKATGQVPHGGGKRFDIASPHYDILRRWIEQGAPHTPADAPKLVRVAVEPASRSLAPNESFPLHVFAHFSDGSQKDVTDACAFQSNDAGVCGVNANGVLQAGPVPGEAAVMVRYMNNIAVCAVTIPLGNPVAAATYENLPRYNDIDGLVWKKLQLLGMLPSAPASEATFHRRAYLRTIGRLPSPDETRAFLADGSPDKRRQLIDRLLERPEYGDFWANKWADLLRPNPYRVGMKAVYNLDAWLRDVFRKNKPYDQFVRELLTAQGSTWRDGATVVFRDRPDTVEIGAMVSQLFLGVRLECAKCHHHPFEVWSQDDFYGFASFFARVGHVGGLSPPISGEAEIIFTKPTGELYHGRTGALMLPKTLNGSPLTIAPGEDPRKVLVDWMTDPANPFFAKVMANRVWTEIMGQGIVDPVDDIRMTNPATNEALLEFLAADFRQHGYNIKHLIKTITTSYVFGLSSTPTERNISDLKNFSRFYRRRLRAEVMLDAVNDVLGTEEKFSAMPPGSRAIQLWTHRSASLFLDTFGRPDPNQDPPCERMPDFTTPQVLHLMNSPELGEKLSFDSAQPAKLSASDASKQKIVEEAYLRTYCRLPSDDEMKTAAEIVGEGDRRRKGIEDLFWALLNTPEFLYVD